MEKKYYNAVDYVKFICAILVICVHTGPLLSINENANFFLVQILARIAVPFFFVASSFFFFRKLDYEIGLHDEVNTSKLKAFFIRIGKLYLVWTLIYLTLHIISWISGGFTVMSIVRYIRDFFFTGSYYHLWFLPALIFAVGLVYYLANRYSKSELFLISLVFYLIGMIINVYQDFLLMIPGISFIIKLYLNIFVTARNGLFFGFVFTVMGYLFARKNTLQDTNTSLIATGISFVLLVLEAYLISWLGYMRDLTSMYFMLIPFIYYLFATLLQYTSNVSNNTCVLMRKMSTLIYVSHIYFCFIIGKIPFVNSNSFIYFTVVCVVTCVFSYFVIMYSKNSKLLRSLYE